MNTSPKRPIFSKEQVARPLQSEHGETVYEMIGTQPESGGAQLHSLAHISIAPGKASLPHHHLVSEESYYILRGRARLVIDGNEYNMSPGTACLILPGQVHQIFNDGVNDLQFLAFCAPPWHPDDSYFESEASKIQP